MDWNALWTQLQAVGPAGVILAAVILVFVYLGTATDLLKNGTLRRAAVILMGYLFSGGSLNGMSQDQALTAAIAMVGATLFKLIVDALVIGLKAVQTEIAARIKK